MKKLLCYARLHAIVQLMRLDKPVGIWLLLWPTLWGLLIAGHGQPALKVSLIFVLGTVLMRSAGCVLNDIADRHWDGAVTRTALRPLVTGALSVRQAYWIAALLVLLAFILVCQLHWQVVLWSVPALLLAISYPYTKRFFAIPQAYLGLAFGFGIPMAFVAIQGAVPPLAWALVLATMLWAVAYDTAYAMVDRKDDLIVGIRSSAITFGRYEVAAIMLCHAGFLGIWALLGQKLMMAWPFWVGYAIATGLVIKQYRMISTRLPPLCFQAFLNNTWIGMSITLGLASNYWIRLVG